MRYLLLLLILISCNQPITITEQKSLIGKSIPLREALRKVNVESKGITVTSQDLNTYYLEVTCLNTELDMVLDIVKKEITSIPVLIKAENKVFTVTKWGGVKSGDNINSP